MDKETRQELETHNQSKMLTDFLQRFNKSDYKATTYEKHCLESMLIKIEWVLKNCIHEKVIDL